MEQVNYLRANHETQKAAEQELHPPKARVHACRSSRHAFQQACDHLKRAERDLAETAAFIVASLTTVAAVQAVVAFVQEKLGLSTGVLLLVFLSFLGIFIFVFMLGVLRISSAIRRRTKAEREIDQTKRAIFEFCQEDEWPKPE
jgi:hypothetical protein